MTQPNPSYLDGIDVHALERARRRVAQRDMPMPIDTLDIGCTHPGCWATYTAGERHEHADEPEQVTPARIVGMTIFVLLLFGAIAYALPILGQAVAA